MDAETMRARARRLADDVLFPAALEVDRADRIPDSHFRALAGAGLYGVATAPVAEALASGCLATAFVWIQHHGPVSAAPPAMRAALESGELRGGIALAGARGGQLNASKVDGGYRLDGHVPWVTGWDLVHVLQVAALDGDDIAFFLIDAAASDCSLRPEPVTLVAANASRTVTLHFRQHFVPADRFTGSQPYTEWQRNEANGSALNGCLALGVARRCSMLMDGAFDAEIDACRALLLGPDVPAARATASELAVRAAATLIVHTGSRAVLMQDHAQRLMREAAFLLVFGTRPLIKQQLLGKLSR